MVELIVVIGILIILAGLLLPVISRVRKSAYQADTSSFIATLSAASQRYYDDHKAYPGPIHNNDIRNPAASAIVMAIDLKPATGFDTSATYPGFDSGKLTGSENLVLGLCGGLIYDTTVTPNRIRYDASKVGAGPSALVSGGKTYPVYCDAVNLTSSFMSGSLKHGHFSDAAGDADDSTVPEFVDRYPDAMPLLYLRSRISVTPISPGSATSNSVITNGSRNGPYDISHIIAYTGTYSGTYPTLTEVTTVPPAAGSRAIGVGKEGKSDYTTTPTGVLWHGLRTVDTAATLSSPRPFDAFAYFKDPSSSNLPRAKDSFIIISAGTDRVYGTSDDITTFGPVQ